MNSIRARVKWFEHFETIGEERQLKRLVRVEMRGRRPRGNPRTRWKDVIRRDLETSGLSLEKHPLKTSTVTNRDESCRPHTTKMLLKLSQSKSSQRKLAHGLLIK